MTRADIQDAPAELRAGLCYRVSTEEQKKHGFSIDDQERTLRGYCAENRISIVEEIYEEGESGRNSHRESVRCVQELAVADAMDLVLTTRRDRLFRNMAGQENHERKLRRLGVALESLDDTGSRTANRFLNVLSEAQVEWMREATRKGRRERARSGQVVAGVTPFGLSFNDDKTNFVVDEAAMQTVRRIFGAAGVPLNSIKMRLGLKGLDADLACVHEELRKMENVEAEERRLQKLPALVASYLRDLPELVEGYTGEVRDYETVPPGRTPDNPHGIYRATEDSIRWLSEEVARRVTERDRERGERYAAIYWGLGLRGVLSPDGTLELTWTGGGSALRVGSDTSKNKHATKHFHATEHPVVQSFQPGENWRYCYVDGVLV